jgi:hypothetical protein
MINYQDELLALIQGLIKISRNPEDFFFVDSKFSFPRLNGKVLRNDWFIMDILTSLVS